MAKINAKANSSNGADYESANSGVKAEEVIACYKREEGVSDNERGILADW